MHTLIADVGVWCGSPPLYGSVGTFAYDIVIGDQIL
jgi:hypothetical protein